MSALSWGRCRLVSNLILAAALASTFSLARMDLTSFLSLGVNT